MKFWTIQTKNVLEIVHEKGIFQPDFNKSRSLKLNSELKNLYYFILESFNKLNDDELPGLVYAFTKYDRGVCSIENINEFRTFMKSKKAVILGLWKSLLKEDVVIIELDINKKFNPIFIDINDFQFLMPPVVLLPPYTEESIDRIKRNISIGQNTTSEFASNVIQAHLPYIKEGDIVNTYPLFDLN